MRLLKMAELGHVRRKHLAGKALIGKGSFASVFAAEGEADRVSKLTADAIGYYMLADPLWHEMREEVERCFPRVIEDHGDVGISGDLPVFLVEVERLYPVSTTEHRRQIGVWAKQYANTNCKKPRGRTYRHADVLNWQSVQFCAEKADEQDNPYRAVFEALHMFLSNYGGALDLKRSNFMCRANGELVWNDVVFDAKTYFRH